MQGDVLTHDVKNFYLKAAHRMIAAVELENHIIIEISDAVLVSRRNRVQEVIWTRMISYDLRMFMAIAFN
jgi:hypothetical protein